MKGGGGRGEATEEYLGKRQRRGGDGFVDCKIQDLNKLLHGGPLFLETKLVKVMGESVVRYRRAPINKLGRVSHLQLAEAGTETGGGTTGRRLQSPPSAWLEVCIEE